ncbi:MAG: hypothetical protein KH050_06040 [Clostridiaceae bacterium]|nr:hypothetical protein [Clostridiaceae bacterium]
MKKRFTALMLMLAILIIPAAAAKTYRQQIAVEYGISLEINGEQAVLTDPNGKTVQPFVYNGTTYVPIRAVAENFGAYVGYDSSDNTAFIYDDYTEILVAAYMLEKAATHMQDSINLLYDNIASGYSQDVTSAVQTCSNYISNNRAMLTQLSNDNLHYYLFNESYGNMGSILDHYNLCLTEYQNAISAYSMLSSSKLQSGIYLDSFHQAAKNIILPKMFISLDVEKLMKDSNWRDITNM